MNQFQLTRRALLVGAAGTAFAAGSAGAAVVTNAMASRRHVSKELVSFIDAYMKAMDAPALTLALVDANGAFATDTYGWADPAARQAATTRHRFQIGSISKSFAALIVLQLHEEGKLGLRDSIFKHLPWLPATAEYGDVSIHHLLSHTSGMPGDEPMIPALPDHRVRQAYAPGTRFHYSNWGYEVIGTLIAAIDGRSFQESLTKRVLEPLGMTDTAAALTGADRNRTIQSYVPMQLDRPYVRGGPLQPAPPITSIDAAGCIASTPDDMARYIQMLIRRGQGPRGRIVSTESFDLFSTRHVAAEEFGPGASYGYGIAVDQLDGHARLRHTGGMVSFMSALQVDLDAGVGAFASINAMLGYRPNPVTEYAIRLLGAEARHASAPARPDADVKTLLDNAADYAGTYTSPSGGSLTVTAEGKRLLLDANGRRAVLERTNGDVFAVNDPSFALFPVVFGRAAAPDEKTPDAAATSPESKSPDAATTSSESKSPDAATTASESHSSEAATPPPVIELGHGSDWYVRSGATAPDEPAATADLTPYPGIYHCENPWWGPVRVVERRRRLWLNGEIPLESVGLGVFRFADEPGSPEVVEFSRVVGSRSQLLTISGNFARRVGDSTASA